MTFRVLGDALPLAGLPSDQTLVVEDYVYSDPVIAVVRIEGSTHADRGLDDVPEIARWKRLGGSDDAPRFWMQFAKRVSPVLLESTARATGTLEELRYDGTGWWLTAQLPGNDAVQDLRHRLENRGLHVHLHRIRSGTDGEPTNALTDAQAEALVLALDRGHFDVPRGVSLQELGEELGVSGQAVSQRLRRAIANLLDEYGLPGEEASDGDEPLS